MYPVTGPFVRITGYRQGRAIGELARSTVSTSPKRFAFFAALQEEVAALKAERKATKRHIPFHDLPEEERFKRLSTQSKHFIDTIKMTAYDAVRHLCAEINRTELLFPGTELRLVYELVSSHNRRDQEV